MTFALLTDAQLGAQLGRLTGELARIDPTAGIVEATLHCLYRDALLAAWSERARRAAGRQTTKLRRLRYYSEARIRRQRRRGERAT